MPSAPSRCAARTSSRGRSAAAPPTQPGRAASANSDAPQPSHRAAAGGGMAVAAREFTAVDIEERSSGTFYISGAIEGIGELGRLVDPGSSYLVNTQAMLEQLKEQGGGKYSRNLEGRMADGSARV